MATANPLEELLKQPREAREAAVDALLKSLEDEMDSDVEQSWLEEIKQRFDDREPGIPAETVFAEGLARLDQKS